MQVNRIGILCRVLKIDLVFETHDGILTAFFDNTDESPLMQSAQLRKSVREGAEAQTTPFLRKDSFDCYFAGIHTHNRQYRHMLCHYEIHPYRRRFVPVSAHGYCGGRHYRTDHIYMLHIIPGTGDADEYTPTQT